MNNDEVAKLREQWRTHQYEAWLAKDVESDSMPMFAMSCRMDGSIDYHLSDLADRQTAIRLLKSIVFSDEIMELLCELDGKDGEFVRLIKQTSPRELELTMELAERKFREARN